jgi:hypothetical protein
MAYCTSPRISLNHVTDEFCGVCPFRVSRSGSIRGMGDVAEMGLNAAGITKSRFSRMSKRKRRSSRSSCGGCGSRQATMNRLIPFSASRVDRRWSVVITTAPREISTVHECVGSLRKAGWEPVIFAEPGSHEVHDAETVWNDKKLGVWHNFLSSSRWAIDNTPAEYIMTVQDDSVFHPDSKSFTESIVWPSQKTGFVSLYTPLHYSSGRRGNPTKPGVNLIRTGSLWGACAIVWPISVLNTVVNHPITREWVGAISRGKKRQLLESRKKDSSLIANSDTAIGKIVNELNREMWFIDPSPVRHIATVSSISHGGNTGKRNCSRCADHAVPLADQVPKPPSVYEIDGHPVVTGKTGYDIGARRMSKMGYRNSMAIPLGLWESIRDAVQPDHLTLEFGCGVSTTAFDGSASHTAVEQDRKLASRFRCAVHTELVDGWYDWSPDEQYDVILVDGPWNGTRSYGLQSIRNASRPGTIVFVDDTHREDEKSLAESLGDPEYTSDGTRQWAKIVMRHS